MNSTDNDSRITRLFSQLRQAERDLAPRFSSMLQAAGETRPRHGLLQPTIGLAVTALSMSILAIVMLRPDGDGGVSDDPNQLQVSADAMQLSIDDEMPTDFLLDTPWPQLASLEPGTPQLDLPYELLEERTNEP